MQVPILDFANLIGNARMQKNFAHELEDGFSEVGFIVLKNHPISHKLQADFHKACLDVFRMSLEEKKVIKCQVLKASEVLFPLAQKSLLVHR